MKKIIIYLSVCMAGEMIVAVAWWLDSKYMCILGLCLCLIMLVLCIADSVKQNRILKFLVTRTKSEFNQKENVQETALIRKRIELSIFDNQINPHFLYNTLENIRGEALDNEQQSIADMTERLARFFRYCISSRGLFVKLSEEIRNVNDYICIQKYRFGNRIELKTYIEDERVLDYFIPKLTLQPIVENAIVHGFENTGRQGYIMLSVKVIEKNVYMYVEDDGEGMAFEEVDKINNRLKRNQVHVSVLGRCHTGIAIQNISARFRLCFGEEYGMHYRSVKGRGTQVEITMPLVDEYSRVELENRCSEVG